MILEEESGLGEQRAEDPFWEVEPGRGEALRHQSETTFHFLEFC